jgi:hypothetical protein
MGCRVDYITFLRACERADQQIVSVHEEKPHHQRGIHAVGGSNGGTRKRDQEGKKDKFGEHR